MNLRYTLLSLTALAIAGSAVAQLATPRAAFSGFRTADEQITPRLPLNADGQRGGGTVVFSEDFANGFAGNNGGVGPWTVEGANGNIWKRSTTGPNGAYSEPEQIIGSTSVANGYMLFAADSANSDWSGAEPVIVAAPVNWEGSLVSPLMDLSANPYVEVEFQQRLRYCCSDAPNFLEVSTDGGATWPAEFSFSTATGIVGNADPGTQTRKINITAAISANPSTVKIRFRHNAEAGSSHYHWQLDDIAIQVLGDYDLRMTSAGTSQWVAATALTYDSLRYSVYPFNQLRPLPLNMTVLNNGALNQDDAVANFTVTRGATEILNQDQPVPNFVQGETRNIWIDPSFTPPAEAGTYDVDFSITSGAEDPTADNTGSASFAVDQNLYARDLGTVAGFDESDPAASAYILGNAFHAVNDAELYSVSVAIGSQSEVGALIVGELRNSDAEFSVVATTPDVLITAAMMNGTGGSNFTELIFDSPVALTAGSDYLLTIQGYGDIRIGTNGTSEPQSSFVFTISNGTEDWFFTTATPMVRMNFDASVGIEAADRSNGIGLGQNVPNPATNSTFIPYDLAKPAVVTFEVRDLNGKLVMSSNEGKRAAGTYRVDLNTEALSEGVYSYTLTAGDVRMTKRMTVIR